MLRLEFPKSNCHISNQHLQFHQNTKKNTFGTEKTLFKYFAVVNLEKSLSHLKSAL